MRKSPDRLRYARYLLAGSLIFALVLGFLLPSSLLAASDDKPSVPAVEQMGNRGGYYSRPNARYNAHTAPRYNQRQPVVYGNSRYCNQGWCTAPNYSHNNYQGPCEGQRSHSYYRVRRGDTLSEVARYYGVSVQSLARANGLRNPNYIYAGQSLYIPTGGNYHR